MRESTWRSDAPISQVKGHGSSSSWCRRESQDQRQNSTIGAIASLRAAVRKSANGRPLSLRLVFFRDLDTRSYVGVGRRERARTAQAARRASLDPGHRTRHDKQRLTRWANTAGTGVGYSRACQERNGRRDGCIASTTCATCPPCMPRLPCLSDLPHLPNLPDPPTAPPVLRAQPV